MGLKLSKSVPSQEGNLSLVQAQHHFLSYLSQSSYLRKLVSKQRRRMLADGYDLDMSYITEKILAMSFPGERMRAVYRNPLWQVKSVLDSRHPGHYKVYNLCIEESYDASHFHGRVERFPFDDNHVPPLDMIKLFCESVRSWLSIDQKNIAVIHCMVYEKHRRDVYDLIDSFYCLRTETAEGFMICYHGEMIYPAGKGRTGLMVCAYLVYCGMSAEEALHLYAQQRTTNNQGVSIPSQRRYVGYWETVLSFPMGIGNPEVKLPMPCSRELRRIRLYDTVNIESVFVVVSELQEIEGQLYRPPTEVSKYCCRQVKKGHHRTYSPRYFLSYIDDDAEGEKPETEEPRVVVQMDTESSMLYKKTCLDCCFEKPVKVTGDVRIIFYQKLIGSRLFYACFNTSFIKNSLLQFSLQDLDKVGSKGKSIAGPAFCLELLFGPANARGPLSATSVKIDDV